MISSLVSSILTPTSANGANAANAMDRALAQRFEDEKNRPAMATVIAAKPVASRPLTPIVDQGGAAGGIDYFHAAKQMLGQAMGDFRHDVRDAFAGFGFEDGLAGEMTRAVMQQTKDALLWGVGFSVKLMTATVSQTTVSTGAVSASSFSVTARSVEIRVNHSSGVINVGADKVSIESQNHGGSATPEPHLLDISDSDTTPVRSLTTALQALERPESLFDDEEGDRAADALAASAAAVAVTREEPAFKGVLPTIDTPTVITKPEYRSRIMVSSMEHFLNDKGEKMTLLRLDAVIPLSEKVRSPHESSAA